MKESSDCEKYEKEEGERVRAKEEGYTRKKLDKEKREKKGDVIHELIIRNYHPFYLHDASVFPTSFG